MKGSIRSMIIIFLNLSILPSLFGQTASQESKQEKHENPKLERIINYHSIQHDETIQKSKKVNTRKNSFTVLAVILDDNTEEETIIWKNPNRDNSYLSTQGMVGPSGKTEFTHEEQNPSLKIISSIQRWNKKSNRVNANSVPGFEDFKGIVPEVLIFEKALSKKERNIQESYLALKYGISLKRTDFLDGKGKTIFTNDESDPFSNEIFGIGKDGLTSLDQKISSPALKNYITIGVGDFTETNKKNQGELSDGQYFICGNNGGSLTPLNGSNPEDARIWKLIPTNANGTPTFIRLQESVYQNTSIGTGDLFLLIDRSNNGKFNDGSIERIKGNKDENGFITFNNIIWDTDGNGQDYFSFGYIENQEEVAQNNPLSHIRIYPNPVSKKEPFSIEVQLKLPEPIWVRIFNAEGHLIKEIQENSAISHNLHTEINTPGIYFIEVETPEGKTLREVVVQ